MEPRHKRDASVMQMTPEQRLELQNPFPGYINPYYWVDDHPLLYGNNGSLDPGNPWHTCKNHQSFEKLPSFKVFPSFKAQKTVFLVET